MFKISSFFGKFSNILPPHRFIKEVIVKIILNVVGVEIKKDDININRSIIYISADSIVKSEIFLKKKEILEKAKKELSQYKKTITDIL